MCKVMERIAKGTILEHLCEYNIILMAWGRSCLTDLLEFFKEVHKTKDEGKLKGGIYSDFGWMEKKRRYWREIYEGYSDGHRTGKCSLIWKVFSYAYGHEKHRRKLVKNIGGAHCLAPSIAFPFCPRVLLYAANLIKSNMRLLGICRKLLTN